MTTHRRTLLRLAILASVLGLAATEVDADAPTRLKAFVFEHFDDAKGATGACPRLEKAGFEVKSLPRRRAPDALGAHLIVIGSFSDETPAYSAYLERFGAHLIRFVERGGVLLQFTQADQREAAPPFLPPHLRAYRGDADFGTVWVGAPGHPLLADLPTTGDPPRLDVRGVKRLSWESLTWNQGFRTLLAAKKHGTYPALLEGAHGRGRFLLTSLWLDRTVAADGTSFRSKLDGLGETFFRNVERYTRLVAKGRAPQVEPDSPSVTPPPAAGISPEGAGATWGLGPSDLAIYDSTNLKTYGSPAPFLLFGHDLRDEGQYRPDRLVMSNLQATLAFRLPAGGASGRTVELSFDDPKVGPVEVKGRVDAWAVDATHLGVYGVYRFASQTHAYEGISREVRDGEATVQASFDVERGVIQWSSIHCAWTSASREPKKTERPSRKAAVRAYALSAVRPTRYPGFRVDVNEAIDKGVAYLESRQTKAGAYPGLWRTYHQPGVTALTALTLASCDVPLSSRRLERALAWLSKQTPSDTYTRALGLMAFAAAYLSDEAVEAGVRMPPERYAWCRQTASALMSRKLEEPGWTYGGGGGGDFSNTQYAAMGLRAAARLGIEIPDAQWMSVIEFARQRRVPTGDRGAMRLTYEVDPRSHERRSPFRRLRPDARFEVGGFTYSSRHTAASGSMTCGAIAALAIARDALAKRGSPRLKGGLDSEIERLMAGGWAWLDHHWEIDRLPGNAIVGRENEYFLYALERAGVLTSVKLVGGRDWYYEGATYLLAHQQKSGAMFTTWKWRKVTRTKSFDVNSTVPNTCFALLFLKRATPPITGGAPGAGSR